MAEKWGIWNSIKKKFQFGISEDTPEKDAPTVDAVEVVRCKDCKFYHRMTAETGICKLACRHLGNDGFCSEGERKEGNGNE